MRDDLLIHSFQLQNLFKKLVDVIIRAQEYKDSHPNAELESSFHRDYTIAEQLRIELNRILYMEGGREVIEKVQEDALNRLHTFELRIIQ